MKTVKQEVMVGDTNANDVVILGGLSDNARIHLSIPPGMEDEEITLLKEMNGKRKKAQPEEEAPKKEASAAVVPGVAPAN